ncbi:hypothetical protein A7985_04370 [Pseudoalteromonas luteoviolacea]|uniref:N-acetyltransferase domain-containing protein n=1 Tax=Pseudoalteromonas luteoviolacea TaxID=43657 RepID=A0A1C0TV35_9GAMM|nr:GNAT family N-acetyltransferase [Pseudoalteromonas luteoviolacea]MBQ4809732.1 GNAT family N-acetyltransferase [Pseudoalteromonas luteoviolacea]OCQ23187.1 hypothetical protein A7985_04370 [Pseudoalteromonas luteoviolacea]
MQPVVRQAQCDDVNALAKLTEQLGYKGNPNEIGTRLKVILASEQHGIFVAENFEGSVVGWIVAERRLTLTSGMTVEITGLVVASTSRGQGLGKLLVQKTLAWAREIGLDKVSVSSNINRDGSHHFYKHLGFEQLKTSIKYIKYI